MASITEHCNGGRHGYFNSPATFVRFAFLMMAVGEYPKMDARKTASDYCDQIACLNNLVSHDQPVGHIAGNINFNGRSLCLWWRHFISLSFLKVRTALWIRTYFSLTHVFALVIKTTTETLADRIAFRGIKLLLFCNISELERVRHKCFSTSHT